jgi:hypothetical protein
VRGEVPGTGRGKDRATAVGAVAPFQDFLPAGVRPMAACRRIIPAISKNIWGVIPKCCM